MVPSSYVEQAAENCNQFLAKGRQVYVEEGCTPIRGTVPMASGAFGMRSLPIPSFS
jgi:hypothetical protein